MTLLANSDYVNLADRGIAYAEHEQARILVFTSVPLPARVYTVGTCEVLVQIPLNYNQAGNDMFWTYPRLVRVDGRLIPNTGGDGEDTRTYDGRVFYRWSRHWHPGQPGEWRAGRDDVISIYRRVEWALHNPIPS